MKTVFLIIYFCVACSALANDDIDWHTAWIDSSNRKVATSMHFYIADRENPKVHQIMMESVYVECFISWSICQMGLSLKKNREKKLPHEYINLNKLAKGIKLRKDFLEDPLAVIGMREKNLVLGAKNFYIVYKDTIKYKKMAKAFKEGVEKGEICNGK